MLTRSRVGAPDAGQWQARVPRRPGGADLLQGVHKAVRRRRRYPAPGERSARRRGGRGGPGSTGSGEPREDDGKVAGPAPVCVRGPGPHGPVAEDWRVPRAGGGCQKRSAEPLSECGVVTAAQEDAVDYKLSVFRLFAELFPEFTNTGLSLPPR